MNPYKILGVKKKSTKEEIKEAYRDLSKKYHPDNQETGDEAKMKQINEAYSILTNKEQKEFYDAFGFVKESKNHEIYAIVIRNFRNHIVRAIENGNIQIEIVQSEFQKQINDLKEKIKTIENRLEELDEISTYVEMEKKSKVNCFYEAIDELTDELKGQINSDKETIKRLKKCIKIAKNYKTIKKNKTTNEPQYMKIIWRHVR